MNDTLEIKDFCLWGTDYKKKVQDLLGVVDKGFTLKINFTAATSLNKTLATLLHCVHTAGFTGSGYGKYKLSIRGDMNWDKYEALPEKRKGDDGYTFECHDLYAYLGISQEWIDQEKAKAEKKAEQGK